MLSINDGGRTPGHVVHRVGTKDAERRQRTDRNWRPLTAALTIFKYY